MLSLAWPWLLLLWPLPWLLQRLRPTSATRHPEQALRVAAGSLLWQQAAHSASTPHTSRWQRLLFLMLWSLLILAGSRPQWQGEPLPVPEEGRDIWLAVDLSGSMQTADQRLRGRTVNRLQVVKQVAKEFIQQRQGDRIGLVLFGQRAYLQTPLTFDHHTVQHFLDEAVIGLAGQKTAIGDAIGLVLKHGQKKAPRKQPYAPVLILLTDGANTAGTVSPLDAAQHAARQGLRIYTIGLASGPMRVPGLFGPRLVNPGNELDESSMQAIAKTTGGSYFRARNVTELRQVYGRIDQLEKRRDKERVVRPIQEYFFWPLGAACMLGILGLAWANRPARGHYTT